MMKELARQIAEINVKQVQYCRGSRQKDEIITTTRDVAAKLRRFGTTKVGVNHAFCCRVAHYRS